MDVATHVGSILAPMTAITGAATVGGIAELTWEWAHLGWQTSITARTIGISTNSLQSIQGAATLAGISAEALPGGLKTLGRTKEDAVTGRN